MSNTVSSNDMVKGYKLNLGTALGGWEIECNGDGYISLMNTDNVNSIHDNKTIPLSSELVSKLNIVDDEYEQKQSDGNRAAAIINTINEYIQDNYGDDAILSRDVDALVEHCKDGVIENDGSYSDWVDGEAIASVYLQECILMEEDGEKAQEVIQQLDAWIQNKKQEEKQEEAEIE